MERSIKNKALEFLEIWYFYKKIIHGLNTFQQF